MKAKYAIYIIIIGFVINVIAGWLKIGHYMNANLLFLVGGILEVTGIAILIYKVFRYQKFRDFLNK